MIESAGERVEQIGAVKAVIGRPQRNDARCHKRALPHCNEEYGLSDLLICALPVTFQAAAAT